MASKARACPSCGTQVAGRFCSECGVPLKKAPCPQCSEPIDAGALFCSHCGHGVGLGKRTGGKRSASAIIWAITGTAVLVTIVVAIVFGRSPAPAPAGQSVTLPSNVGAPLNAAGRAPAVDLTNLTPRERADQFFDHIMRADERGDTAEVMVFRPMALAAYGELDELDGDARFHVGLIEAISGGADAALAQADSLDLAVSGHLLASNIRHTVAEKRGDVDAARRAYRAFLDNYEPELASRRPEYAAHQQLLEAFRTRAQQALSDSGT